MNFVNLPLWGIGVGLAALAGGLFFLQMLRVRHRQIEVPTTMFWREAVEESRARVLRQRFRHPWAYVLLLAIAALLWLAIAGLTAQAKQGQDYLLVLDGSVGMSHPNRFESAVELLHADASGLPASSREVWWSGAQTQLLLGKGEHALLLSERLQGKQPQASASAVEQRVLQMAAQRTSTNALQVRIYGDAPFSEQALALLPENVEVLRCTPLAPQQLGNMGFLAGGLAEATSGNWDRVDLFLHVTGTSEAPQVKSDGLQTDLVGAATTTENGVVWRFLDVPARGQILDFQLSANDRYPADNQLILALPQRQPLQVLISPSLQAIFEPLVSADSAFTPAVGAADLVVRRQGETIGEGLPALEIASAPANGFAFEITAVLGQNAEQLLQSVHQKLGLAEIDALALAQKMQQPISLGVAFGEQRKIQLWDQLLDPEGGFVSSRSFPLFIGRSLRWLANTQAFASVARTGQPLAFTSEGSWTGPDGARFVTASLPLRAGEAGLYRSNDGRTLSVHAFDPVASLASAAILDASPGAPIQTPSLPLWSWLVLVAVLLLAAEWMLFQTGRIP